MQEYNYDQESIRRFPSYQGVFKNVYTTETDCFDEARSETRIDLTDAICTVNWSTIKRPALFIEAALFEKWLLEALIIGTNAMMSKYHDSDSEDFAGFADYAIIQDLAGMLENENGGSLLADAAEKLSQEELLEFFLDITLKDRIREYAIRKIYGQVTTHGFASAAPARHRDATHYNLCHREEFQAKLLGACKSVALNADESWSLRWEAVKAIDYEFSLIQEQDYPDEHPFNAFGAGEVKGKFLNFLNYACESGDPEALEFRKKLEAEEAKKAD